MALSDCLKCWSTPCCCGYDFRNYDPIKLSQFIASTTEYQPKDEALRILNDAIVLIKERKK